MQMQLSYSDLSALISALKHKYKTHMLHDFEALDLIELEFRLSQHLIQAYSEDKFVALTSEELKLLEDKTKSSLWADTKKGSKGS